MNQESAKIIRRANEIMNGTEKTYKALKKDYNSWSDEKKNELKEIIKNLPEVDDTNLALKANREVSQDPKPI